MKRIATIGFFDGVHGGHRYLFEQLSKIGAARGLEPLIVTFEQHPRTVLQEDYVPKLITTTEERRALLGEFGEVLMLDFAAIQGLTAEQFMVRLKEEYDVEVLLMGYDHRFGSDGLRDSEAYQQIGKAVGIEVLVMGEYEQGAQHVSSTEIRLALEQGDIEKANALLERSYAITGTVVHGKGLGRTIGFPTANVQSEPLVIVPKAAVYEVKVKGERLKDEGVNELTNERVSELAIRGMCNIDKKGIIEVHIPGYSGDLYGKTITIEFVRFVREEKRFETLDKLREQIKADVDSILHRG